MHDSCHVPVGPGDVVDRGPHSVKLLSLLRRLKGEAEAAGGEVVTLLVRAKRV